LIAASVTFPGQFYVLPEGSPHLTEGGCAVGEALYYNGLCVGRFIRVESTDAWEALVWGEDEEAAVNVISTTVECKLAL
jgi:hypothetical protein